MKVLNLYAGVGGNRALWGTEHEITAVESNPEIAHAYAETWPDKVIVADAHQYLLEHFQEFDFIWSSPPCPTHSKVNNALQGWGIVRYPDMALYQEIILLQHFFKGNWVVENVIPYYEALIQPTAELNRHCFWANFPISEFHEDAPDVVRSTKENLAEYHGLTLPDTLKNKRKILRNAVYPPLGKHILDQLPVSLF